MVSRILISQLTTGAVLIQELLQINKMGAVCTFANLWTRVQQTSVVKI
jgi:hypothetical protein